MPSYTTANFRNVTSNLTSRVYLGMPSFTGTSIYLDPSVATDIFTLTTADAILKNTKLLRLVNEGAVTVNSFFDVAEVQPVLTATTALTAAQVCAFNGGTGGDITLVAAKSGVVLVPTMVQIATVYGTAELGAGDDLQLTLGTVASGITVANIDKSAIIPGTSASAQCLVYPELFNGSATSKGVITTSAANKALTFNIKSGGSQYTIGTTTGTFSVKVFYKEIALI